MLTRYLFDDNGFLTGMYQGTGAQPNSTMLSPIYNDGFTPQFVDGAWIDHTVAPKVSPVQFKLLFTAPERIAIKTSTDPVVQDFFEIVNDPRLTHVDLGLQSTKDALAYLAAKKLIALERQAIILAGIVQ